MQYLWPPHPDNRPFLGHIPLSDDVTNMKRETATHDPEVYLLASFGSV